MAIKEVASSEALLAYDARKFANILMICLMAGQILDAAESLGTLGTLES